MKTYIGLFVMWSLTLAFGYPAAAMVAHGLVPRYWPAVVITPSTWFYSYLSFSWGTWINEYWLLLVGRSPAFAIGGPLILATILAPASAWTAIRLFGAVPDLPRDKTGVFGNARFATTNQLSSMNVGLELGRNPDGGEPVRVRIEGTLVTIAPPRKGKTSGLLIPNLAFPEPQSWDGPAVVFDTKGEIYKAVADRRRAMGRKVICLDPLDLASGDAMWNPLQGVKASDILYLQRTALALLPEAEGRNESSAYFRNRAVDLIVGAMVAAIFAKTQTPQAVFELLCDETLLLKKLRECPGYNPAVLAALDILQADPKTKDPVRSTAAQAFQWITDARLGQLVSKSTFQLSEVCTSDADIFVAIPPEYTGLFSSRYFDGLRAIPKGVNV